MAGHAVFLLMVGAAAFSTPASAHGNADTLHQISDGVVLFFTALEFLLPVLIVALLAQPNELRLAIIQAAALGIGLLTAVVGLQIPGDPSALGLYARGYLIVLGLLVLTNLRIPTGVVLVVVLVTGMLTGLEAGEAVNDDPAAGSELIVGFLSSAICFYFSATLVASRYTEGWQRIAMRVVASWIVAIAVLDIAFMSVRSG
ncbi:MAG: HupE/UreJ family protein [Candidatus Thiodiazotropha taylori]|nr:HupE/UreJ family protein [Candidatus Thiodiazotropha taylori]